MMKKLKIKRGSAFKKMWRTRKGLESSRRNGRANKKMSVDLPM